MPTTLAGYNPIDDILSGKASGALQGDANFIAFDVFDPIVVSGEAYKGQLEVKDARVLMGQDTFVNMNRAAGAPYAKLNNANPTFVSYECTESSGYDDIDMVQLAKMRDGPEEYKRYMATVAGTAIRAKLERDMSTLLFTLGNWGANTSTLAALPGGSTFQIGVAGATEFSDLLVARELARLNSFGILPDSFLIGYVAFDRLRRALDIRNFIGNDKQRVALPDDELASFLAGILGVDRVVVGRARVENAAPGVASSQVNVWGDSACFYHSGNDGASAEMVGGIRVTPRTAALIWQEIPDFPDFRAGAREFQENNPPTQFVVAEAHYDILFVPPTTGADPMGYLITDMVA